MHKTDVSWARRVFCLLLLATLFLGCGRSANLARKWPDLRIGYLPVAAELPLFVAVEEGFFKEEGLTITLTQLPSSNELTNAATADIIDLLAGAATNVVFDAGSVSGKHHKLFAINPYSDKDGFVTDHLLVGTASGITEPNGLRGKRVASFPGSVVVLVYLVLEKYGVGRDEYQSIQMLPKDWQPSLQSGAIDAVVALEPSATQIIQDGIGNSILPGFYAKLMEDMPLSGHWFADDFLKRADPRQIAATVRAYQKAIAFCYDSPQRAKMYLPKYANVRSDILNTVNLNPWKMTSPEDAAELTEYADLLASNGGLLKPITVDDYLLPPQMTNRQ